MDKTKAGILVVIALAVGLSWWLSQGDEVAKTPAFAKDKIEFPREVAAKKRIRNRRTKARARAKDAPLDTDRPKVVSQQAEDSLQRALGDPDKKGTVFVEVNAIANSPLAQKIMQCKQEQILPQLAKIKKQIGVDPAQDVDRLAFSEGSIGMTGYFQDLALPPEAGEPETYGESGRIYDLSTMEGGQGFMALVGGELMVMGNDVETVKAAIDRVDGNAPASPPLPQEQTLSELYGSLDKAAIKKVITQIPNPIATRAAELIEGGRVQMNVGDQVTSSFDFEAKDEQSASDLSKMLGGGIAALRQQARSEGNDEMAWLLEKARVRPGKGNRFQLDVAVPGDVVLKLLGCNADGSAAPAKQEATPPVAPAKSE